MLTQTMSGAIPNEKTDGKPNLFSSISSQTNSSNVDLFKQVFDDHIFKEQRLNKIEEKDKPKNSQNKQVVQADSKNPDNNDIEDSSASEAKEQDGTNEDSYEELIQDQTVSIEDSSEKTIESKFGETICLVEDQLTNSKNDNDKAGDKLITIQDETRLDNNETNIDFSPTLNIVVEANKSLEDSLNNKVTIHQDESNKYELEENEEEIEKLEIQENDQAVNPQITLDSGKTQDTLDNNLNLDNTKNVSKNFDKENVTLDINVSKKDETGNISLDELVNKSVSDENTLEISLDNRKEEFESVKGKEKQQLQPAELNSKNLSNSLQNKFFDKNDMQEGTNDGQNFGQPNNLEAGIINFDNDKLNLSFKEIASNFSDNVPHRVDQISLAVKTCVQNNRKEISINMYPETLGKVDVKLEFNKDQIVAIKIFAEKPETLKILIKDISTLQKSLSEVAKADDASLSFNLKDDQNGNEYEKDRQLNRSLFSDESVTISNYSNNQSLHNGDVNIMV